MTSSESQHLFSYGTLQNEAVQQAHFGRKLNGHVDSIAGYELSMVTMQDADIIALSGEEAHPIIRFTGNHEQQVFGYVFAVSEQDLQQADDYETDDYKRVQVTLNSGLAAWVYIAKA
jgi:gamma-glutamylcyclotransferase (GGCT)/AIG2-like uncharacterized protein YtfP